MHRNNIEFHGNFSALHSCRFLLPLEAGFSLFFDSGIFFANCNM